MTPPKLPKLPTPPSPPEPTSQPLEDLLKTKEQAEKGFEFIQRNDPLELVEKVAASAQKRLNSLADVLLRPVARRRRRPPP